MSCLEQNSVMVSQMKALMEEETVHAACVLHYHSMCLHNDVSSRAMIQAVRLLCNNSVQSIISVLNKIMKNTSKSVTVQFPSVCVKLSIHDVWKFKILLISGLKFLPANLYTNRKAFLETEILICNAMSLFDIHNNSSVYLIDLSKYAFTMSNQKLSQFCAWTFITTFIRVINAHATFRKHTEEIIRMSVKLLPFDMKSVIINELRKKIQQKKDIPCFLLGEVLKNSSCAEIQNCCNELSKFIFDGFTSNIDGVQRSYVYNGLLQNVTYEAWQREILPMFLLALEEYEENDCFLHSVQKYFLPMTIAKYGRIVYDTFRNYNISMKITGYTLLLIVKQGMCKPLDYIPDLLAYIGSSDDYIAIIGLDILCRFKSKHDDLQKLHYGLLIHFLEGNAWINDVGCTLKALHLFHSHLIIRTNVLLNKKHEERDLQLVIQYLQFLYHFLIIQIGTKCHIRNEFGFRIYTQVCELFMSDSSKLIVDYNLTQTDRYTERNCKAYTVLLELQEWKFTNSDALKTLMYSCCNYSSVPAGLSNLISFFDLSNEDVLHMQTRALELQNLMSPSNSSGVAILYIMSMHNKLSNVDSIKNGVLHVVINLLHERFEKLKLKHFHENVLTYPIHPLLKVIVLVLQNSASLDALNYRNVFTLCGDIINLIISQGEIIMFLDSTSVQKTVEAILIEALTCMLCILHHTNDMDLARCLMDICLQVINSSNMKRPVTTGASTLKDICKHVVKTGFSEECVLIFDVLEEALVLIMHSPTYCVSKIRCSSENRLVIHSICTSDTLPGKPLLCRTMNFLIGVLKAQPQDELVVPALHCLETLMTDNSIRQSTNKYLTDAAWICMGEFTNPSWRIRNAALQLLKAIFNRLLGQNARYNGMRKCTEEVFQVYPTLAPFLYRKITSTHGVQLEHNSIAVLTLFAELHAGCNSCSQNIKLAIHAFVKVFISMITSDSGNFGLCSASAYASQCNIVEIPLIIYDIVQYIKLNFNVLSKNVFRNLVYTVNCLFSRQQICYSRVDLLEDPLVSFGKFLRLWNNEYKYSLYPLLSLRSNSVYSTANELLLICNEKRSYRHWLHVNVPYVIESIDAADLPLFLKQLFATDLMQSLLLSCLSSIIQRFKRNDFDNDEILSVLICKLFDLPRESRYLKISFAQVIHFLYDNTKNFIVDHGLLKCFRSKYESDNCIYSFSVRLLLLSKVDHQETCYNDFIDKAVSAYQRAVFDDEEIAHHASCTLVYLYNCLKNISDKLTVIKLAVFLLLRKETEYEIRKFASHIFSIKLLDAVNTLQRLLCFKNLYEYFKNSSLIYDFLVDVVVITSKIYKYENSRINFYVVEDMYSNIPRVVVEKILIASFMDYIKFQHRQSGGLMV